MRHISSDALFLQFAIRGPFDQFALQPHMKQIPKPPASTALRTVARSRTLPAILLSIVAAGSFAGWSRADNLASWSFSGATGDQATQPPASAAAGLTASDVTRGSGLTASGAGNSISSSGWTNSTTPDANDYYQFGVTINGSTTAALTSVSFQERRSATGIRTFVLRSSLDGYVGNIAAPTGVPDDTANRDQTITLPASFASLTNQTVTFRLYGYSAEAAGGTWRLNNHGTLGGLVIEGTTTTGGGPDTTPPAFTPTTPANGATEVAIDTNLVFSASETVTAEASKNLVIKKADTSVAQTISVTSAAVTVSGTTITVDPPADLEPNTTYYIDIDAGAFKDAANNLSDAYSGTTSWSFTTPAPTPEPTASPVVISQYYEGTSFNKWIELHNTTSEPVSLDGYKLTLWSNPTNGKNQQWKTEGNTPSSSMDLTGVTLAPGQYYLLSHEDATTPAYATADVKSSTVINFNGDDSVVLYKAAEITRANIADAISVAGNTAANISIYRVTNDVGFDYEVGTEFGSFSSVWATKTNSEVDAATAADDFQLKGQSVAEAGPEISVFAVAFDQPQAIEKVTANYLLVEGSALATEYRIAESEASLSAASWNPVTSPIIYSLPSGTGEKTVYFQLRNEAGMSAVVSDTIERVAYSFPGNVVISQYSSDSVGDNKYIELSNRTEADIDLTGWTIGRWSNQDTQKWSIAGLFPQTSPNATVVLDGVVIPAGGTIVLAGATATSPILAADAALNNAQLNFNGNDSVVLYSPGIQSPVTLVDVVSFTETGGPESLGEGRNTSFVRIADTQGFDFDGSPLTSFPAVWQEVSLEVVVAATVGQNEHLGTYPGGSTPPGNTYTTWAAANADGQGPNGDFDNDGVKNGVEYFFGSTGSTVTLNPGIVAGAVSFPRDVTATSATGTVYTSTNLVTWTAVVSGDPNLDTTNPAIVKYTLPTGQGKIFVRLDVTIAP